MHFFPGTMWKRLQEMRAEVKNQDDYAVTRTHILEVQFRPLLSRLLKYFIAQAWIWIPYRCAMYCFLEEILSFPSDITQWESKIITS